MTEGQGQFLMGNEATGELFRMPVPPKDIDSFLNEFRPGHLYVTGVFNDRGELRNEFLDVDVLPWWRDYD